MITRKEYLNTENPFDRNTLEGRKHEHKSYCDYHRQFAKASATGSLLLPLTQRALCYDKLNAHLNDIELKNWDNLHYAAQQIFNARKMTDATYPGKYTQQVFYSLSDTVVMAKLIVRDYLLANGYVETWEMGKYCWECFLVKETKEIK